MITDCAEQIVILLKKLGGANIMRLSEHLAERNVVTYQALGWLARERRISYQNRGNQVYVALNEDEHLPTDIPAGESRSS
ncbi:MAG: winged helix-turn-helix domain-containing protein [Spirochaetia bacterium]